MKGRLHVALGELREAIVRKVEQGKKSPARVLNQVGLNVAGRMFDLLPPGSGNGVQERRGEVKRYLTTPLSTRLKQFKKGKRQGRFGKRGARRNQLQLRNLIVNKMRGRAGLKGLQGAAMRRAAGSFSRSAQASQGYLKSTLLPIIVTLNPLCPFKFPFAKTSRVSRWPGSAGYGKAMPASPATQMSVGLAAGGALKPLRPGGVPRRTPQDAKVQGIMDRAMATALEAEAREISRHLEEELKSLA